MFAEEEIRLTGLPEGGGGGGALPTMSSLRPPQGAQPVLRGVPHRYCH